MLERVTKAEQEQQQRAFGPCAQRSGAGGSDQHQRVDLELLHPKVIDRLAQREESAEEIGRDIASGRQPTRRAGHQLLDREPDPQQRAAGEREDQLGIGTKKFGMAMVVTIVGAVLLFFRAVASWAVVMVGMFVCRDAFAHTDLQLAKRGPHLLFGGFAAIIFDPDRPAGAGACLDHAGQGAQRIADRARPTFVVDPRHLPDRMAVALGDFGTCGAHHFAQPWQRQLGGIEMDAQRRWRVAVETDHMRPLDTFAL